MKYDRNLLEYGREFKQLTRGDRMLKDASDSKWFPTKLIWSGILYLWTAACPLLMPSIPLEWTGRYWSMKCRYFEASTWFIFQLQINCQTQRSLETGLFSELASGGEGWSLEEDRFLQIILLALSSSDTSSRRVSVALPVDQTGGRIALDSSFIAKSSPTFIIGD